MTNSSSCSYVSKTENQCYNWFKVEGQEFTCYNVFLASTDLEWCLRLHNTSLQHDCCCCGGVLVYWLWGPSLDTYSCSRQKLPPPLPPLPQARGRWTGGVWAGWSWLAWWWGLAGPGLDLRVSGQAGPGCPTVGPAETVSQAPAAPPVRPQSGL